MIDFGKVKPGTTLYVYFDSFSGSTGASSATTGLAVGDIRIYKDGSVTERASTSGFTLLDTDGQDFDTVTGINGFSINLADNTTAGFYASGSDYVIVVTSVTIDTQTVSFIAGRFTIGYEGSILDTTVESVTSQVALVIPAAAAPAEDDAYNGCIAIIHDVATADQHSMVEIIDYAQSTRTLTLAAGAAFTVAATDNISIYPRVNTLITLPGQEAPPLQPTLIDALGWLFKFMRNRKTMTSTLLQLMADDETTVDAKATISDDGTTAIQQEIQSGP